MQIVIKIFAFSIPTQRISVGLQICKWEVEVQPKLHNLHTDHVTLQSELNYLIGANNLGLQRPGFEVKTGPNAMVRVCHVVKPLQRFSSGSNPNPEPF